MDALPFTDEYRFLFNKFGVSGVTFYQLHRIYSVCQKQYTTFLTSALVDRFLKPFTDTILRKLSNYYSLQGLPSHLNCAAIRLCEIQKSEITAEPLLVPSKLIGRNSTKLNRMYMNKNSSEDEIANVNVLRRHRTCRGQKLRTLN